MRKTGVPSAGPLSSYAMSRTDVRMCLMGAMFFSPTLLLWHPAGAGRTTNVRRADETLRLGPRRRRAERRRRVFRHGTRRSAVQREAQRERKRARARRDQTAQALREGPGVAPVRDLRAP